MSIGAIAFDFGDVLLFSGYDSRRSDWASRFGIDLDAFQRRMWQHMSSVGEMAPSFEEVAERVAAEFDATSAVARDLVSDFHDSWIVDTTLLDATEHLVGVRRGILSNAGRALRFGIEQVPSIRRRVDPIIVSDEVGLEKPDGRIYRLFATRVDVPIERCVLIDDRIENVQGARSVGMLAIQHVSNASTLAALQELASPSRDFA